MSNKLTLIAAAIMLPLTISVNASVINQTKGDFEDKFRQLVQALPTPNVYRNAAG